jgi:hypothetical protein
VHLSSSLFLDLGKCFNQRYLHIEIQSIDKKEDNEDLRIYNALRNTLFILQIEREGSRTIFPDRFRLLLRSD